MGDCCSAPNLIIKVEVQSNGIMRLADTGRYLARLDEDKEVNYEKLKQYNIKEEKER